MRTPPPPPVVSAFGSYALTLPKPKPTPCHKLEQPRSLHLHTHTRATNLPESYTAGWLAHKDLVLRGKFAEANYKSKVRQHRRGWKEESEKWQLPHSTHDQTLYT